MSDIMLNWKIVHAGSATFSMNLPDGTVEVHTTYVGDGLGSIVRAASDLQLGSSTAIAFLPAEPGGTCLFFADANDDAYLQVVDFGDMQSEFHRWSGGSLRWHGRIMVRAFVRAVVRMADEVLAQCGGSDAYSMAWGGIEFPSRDVEGLRRQVS